MRAIHNDKKTIQRKGVAGKTTVGALPRQGIGPTQLRQSPEPSIKEARLAEQDQLQL
jgi:hypothetical protein